MTLGEAYIEIRANEKPYQKSLKNMESATKQSVDRMQKNFNRIKTGVDQLSRTARYAFLGMAAAITGVVYAAAKFEQQMANVATMLDRKSLPIMKKYKNTVGKMAVVFGQSTETLSKGLYNILSATIPAGKALGVLEIAAKGAAAGNTTVDIAVTALTKSMLAFKNLKPHEAMDTLFASIKRGYYNFEELAAAIPGVVTLGASLNLTFEELAGTMAFLSKKFPTVSEAGTALEGVLARIKVPTKDFEDALAALGTDIDEVREKLGTKGLHGTIQWLTDLDMGRGLVQSLFRRKEAMMAITAMTQDIEGFGEDIKEVYESAGATQEAFEKQTATLMFGFNQLKEAGRYLAVQIGEIFTPIVLEQIKKFRNFVANLASAVKNLTTEQKKTIAKMVLLGTAALGAIGALGLFAKLAVLVKAAGLVIMGVCGLIASPLGLIMLAVGALAVAWTYNWGDIQGKVEAVWKVIEPIFQKMWDWISKAWTWIIEIGGEAWKWIKETAYPKLMEWLDKAWIWTVNIAGKAWGWLSETAYPKLMEWLSKAWDWTVEISGKAWDWLSQTAYPFLMEQLSKAWTWTVDVAGRAWEWLSKTAYPFLMDELSKVWAWTVDVAGAAWKWLKETAYPFLMEKLREAWTWTVGITGKAWSWLSETAYPFLMDQLRKAWTWTVGIAGKAWEWLSLTAYPKFMEWLSKAWEWTVNLAGDAWVWIKDELWPRLNEYAVKVWDWSMKALSGTWSWIKDTLWPKLSEYATKAWEWTMVLVGKTWSWIKDELWPALGKVVRVTVEFFQKLIGPPEGAEEQGESWAGRFWKGFSEYLEKIEKTIELKVKFIWDLTTIIGSFFKGFVKGLTKKFEEDETTPLEIAKIIGKGLIDGIKLYIDAEFKAWVWIREAVEEHLEEWKSIGEYIGEKIGGGIREALKWWFKGFKVPEEFKLIEEGVEDIGKATEKTGEIAEKTGEKIKKIIPSEAISKVEDMSDEFNQLAKDLKYNAKYWKIFSQEVKRHTAIAAAKLWLFNDEALKVARKTPVDFAMKFEKAFMSKKPAIQKAILEAITSRDFQRALSLLGVKSAKAFLGRSPGMLTELEKGTKETKKLLDRMLGDMDAMTKKIMKIFQPIIGLFKKMFEGIVETMIASENEAISQMGRDLKGFVDGIIAMMEGLFDTMEKGLDSTVDKAKASWKEFGDLYNRTTKGMKTGWQKFCDWIKKHFEKAIEGMEDDIKSFAGSIKTAIVDAVASVLTGTKSMGDALFDFVKSAGQALGTLAAQAAMTGNYIVAVITAALAVATSMIKKTTTHFETAWGTIGRSMYFVQIEVGKLGEYLKEAGELMYGLKGTTIDLGDAAAYVEREFAKVGLQISESLGAAKTKLEDLYQAQVDLGASTREKLIAELDKYYDYRVLKEKTLEELLALSAETRIGIETGAIAEVEESEEEKAARDKDRAISRLQQIEDQYKKEDELMRRRIALTEIEIKFLELKIEREAHGHSQRAKQLEKELGLMLEAYHEGVEAFKDAEEDKQKAVEDTTKTVKKETGEQAKAVKDAAEDEAEDVEDATEDMGKSWDDLTEDIKKEAEDTWGKTGAVPIALEEAINTMIAKIGTLPTRIDFDVIGNLHLPDIPSIGTRYFDIVGKVNIPSYQAGIPYVPRTTLAVLHRGEEVVPAHKAGAEGRKGDMIFNTRILHTGDITTEMDEERFMRKVAGEITKTMREV